MEKKKNRSKEEEPIDFVREGSDVSLHASPKRYPAPLLTYFPGGDIGRG